MLSFLQKLAIKLPLKFWNLLDNYLTEQLKQWWDLYDGENDGAIPFDIVAIHQELNDRGEGDYCAV